jgi:replicative superfamily II helicase
VTVLLCVCCHRIGRAGRPGFDDSGVAVVMTSKGHQQLYEDMLQGKENVESNLQSVLVEGTTHSR